MPRPFVQCFAVPVLVFLAAVMAAAEDHLPVLEPLEGFPGESAAFGVTAASLNDGRYMLWDGDAILVETGLESGAFETVADGFAGDPGFIAVSPDGAQAVLGAGASGDFYLVATADPGPAEVLINTENNFTGAFISNDQVLFDRALPGDNEELQPELAILDISGEPMARTVVAGKGVWSGGLALSPCGEFALATDGFSGETRVFAVETLEDAFANETVLDWESDGALLGHFSTRGPSLTSRAGSVLFDGFGTLELVNPDTAEAWGVLDDPTGAGDAGLNAHYNRQTHRILVIASVWNETQEITGWLSAEPFESLPHTDVNRDGRVDALDVQLVINAALGLPLPDHVGRRCVDVSMSGGVSAVDIQQVINGALGVQ